MHLNVLSTVWAVAAIAAAVLSPVAHGGATLRQPHRGPDPEPLVVRVDDARFGGVTQASERQPDLEARSSSSAAFR